MALERIAPILREAAVLRFITQLSTEEIAGILGVGLSAVKMRVQRGRQALAEELRDPYGGPVLRLVPKTAE
jgi:RNA polymerase sigma-70 factor (ECF subfamily)